MKVKNASTMPQVYFGLHMVEGVAEYREPGEEPYRILCSEKSIKTMNTSFRGKPVYVGHKDDISVDDIEKADGYVIRSFYNKADGKNWAEFIVVTDQGHEAISKGWKLSNAYHITKNAIGGKWHGVDYKHEVIDGEYEHLAIVPDPRYAESIVLTPEQFKEYNFQKENELVKMANSADKETKPKKEKSTMFQFFKREKVENSDDLATMMVTLPRTKVERTLKSIINEADEKEAEKDEEKMANGGDVVEADGKKMSVSDLIKTYENQCKAMKKKNEEEDEDKKENEDEDEEKKENMDHDEDDMENEDDEDDKENMEDEKGDDEDDMAVNKRKKNRKKNSNFTKMQNAHESFQDEEVTFEMSIDQVARGQARYGSN